MRRVLQAELPHAYVFSENGEAVKFDSSSIFVGVDVNAQALESSATLRDQVQNTVIAPLHEWLQKFSKIKVERLLTSILASF
jgi:hypothetical protein